MAFGSDKRSLKPLSLEVSCIEVPSPDGSELEIDGFPMDAVPVRGKDGFKTLSLSKKTFVDGSIAMVHQDGQKIVER